MTHQFLEAGLEFSSQIPALEVRLARSAEEIIASQRLRYRVFFEEMGARPGPDALATGLDRDEYDTVCQHLLCGFRFIRPGIPI